MAACRSCMACVGHSRDEALSAVMRLHVQDRTMRYSTVSGTVFTPFGQQHRARTPVVRVKGYKRVQYQIFGLGAWICWVWMLCSGPWIRCWVGPFHGFIEYISGTCGRFAPVAWTILPRLCFTGSLLSIVNEVEVFLDCGADVGPRRTVQYSTVCTRV
jgi:hypothetical protein